MSFAYPNNVVRIMKPQINRLKGIVGHHFALRHEDPRRRQAVKNWIQELRRVDRNSGYSIALQQITN